MSSSRSTKRKESISSQKNKSDYYSLFLFNDDYNHYEYVIDSLVEVCNHNRLQAEQCTLIAHHKGKCDIKTGEFSKLKLMKDELSRRGLSSTIVSQ
jgi:ATP-dependent Clp protease adaptor protein ClpS